MVDPFTFALAPSSLQVMPAWLRALRSFTPTLFRSFVVEGFRPVMKVFNQFPCQGVFAPQH